MWKKVCKVEDVPVNGGACVKENGEQIAVFQVENGAKWYAVQNLCPHKAQMVISRGIVGDIKGAHKIACPLHKHSFSLETGEHVGEDQDWKLKTYNIKVENEDVLLEL